MEKYVKQIAVELKRIRIELEKQNSMVEDLNMPFEEDFTQDDQPQEEQEDVFAKLRGNQ